MMNLRAHRFPVLISAALAALVLMAAVLITAGPAHTQSGSSACVTGGAVADATNTGLVSDCGALLAGRDTLAGTATLNWSADRPIAEWDGVGIDGTPERVTRLHLWSRNLDGTLPAELGSLTNLTVLAVQEQPVDGHYSR